MKDVATMPIVHVDGATTATALSSGYPVAYVVGGLFAAGAFVAAFTLLPALAAEQAEALDHAPAGAWT